ncbi:MAG: hypothetical protein GX754_02020 [Clostridiaceae bacterium]|nr:hypothetical protein [Clostridiaceae bacterium]
MNFTLHTGEGNKAVPLMEGPHLFTDWRYIEPGRIAWLSKEGEAMPLLCDLPVEGVRGAAEKVPYGIRIVAQKAVKMGPVIDKSSPHEFIMSGPTIIYDGGKYRMWYSSTPEEEIKRNKIADTPHVEVPGALMNYAESDDGINWRKPSLGLFEYRGSLDNNIIKPHKGAVFKDPSAPESERYKIVEMKELTADDVELFKRERGGREISPICFIKNRIRGIVAWTSPDGIRWKELPVPVMMHFSDTLTIAYFDEILRCYVGYFRMFYCGRRAIGRSETTDFWKWPLPKPILWPGADEPSPSNDYYTNSKCVYPGTKNEHFMFPAVYKRDTDITEIRMYSSHDGIFWSKVPGNPVLETGRPGEWDGGCIFCGCGLIQLPGERIAMPYVGCTVPHKFPRTVPLGNIGYAVWEKERLSALEAPEEGDFHTLPFIVKGRELYLNIQTLRAGYVKVEVLDINGNPLPGRSFEDADLIVADEYKRKVTWKGESDLGNKDGQPVIFHIRMKAAKLYSFEVK